MAVLWTSLIFLSSLVAFQGNYGYPVAQVELFSLPVAVLYSEQSCPAWHPHPAQTGATLGSPTRGQSSHPVLYVLNKKQYSTVAHKLPPVNKGSPQHNTTNEKVLKWKKHKSSKKQKSSKKF